MVASHSTHQRATISSPDSTVVPERQDTMELLTPVDTLNAVKGPSQVSEWLDFISNTYVPPSEKSVLLLYPCASHKPMVDSKTYAALWDTLDQLSADEREQVHVVTVSEPMGLIPWEYQDGETWLYDCPGLFKWWVKDNDLAWDKDAQQQSLSVLGSVIGAYLSRAGTQDWYDDVLACVRHRTATGNTTINQTHRQMIETATELPAVDVTWLPSDEMVETLVEERSAYAWQMNGVSHSLVQNELLHYLT